MNGSGARRMTLRTEIVGTPARLAEIGPAWDALWQRGRRSVFQSHGWLSAWWNARPPSDASRPRVALCWAGDGRLAAAMPLATRRHRGVRVLEWAAKDCSDYCDALVDPEDGHAVLQQAWAVAAAQGGFDLIYLSHVRPDAAFHALLEGRKLPVTLRPGRRTARSLQVRSGGADGRAWLARLGEEAQNHACRLRALGEMGPVAAKAWGPGEPTDALLERMIALKQQWLADTGEHSSIMENDAAVLRALAGELARRRALRLFTVHCGDRLAAALLSIAEGTREQVFFSVQDPHFDRFEPEALVLIECLARAFDGGVTEVDLLCVEDDSKYGYANARLDLGSFVGARTLPGRLALAVGERLDRARTAGASAGDAATR